MADAASTARSMWTLFEPIHAVTYFAPEARSAYEQAGLRGFWRGYFAGRAAPLGAASAAVVTASFFNFAPAFVARAIPGVWELVTPDEALRIRMAGATEALQSLLAGREADAAAAADLLWRAIGELDFSGRVLAAADAALPVPGGGSGPALAGGHRPARAPGRRAFRGPRGGGHRRLRGRGPAVLPGPAAGRPAASARLDRRGMGRGAFPAGRTRLGRRRTVS